MRKQRKIPVGSGITGVTAQRKAKYAAEAQLTDMQCQALEACLFLTSIWDAIYQRGQRNLGEMTIEQRGQSCLHGIAALREQLRDALREAVCAKEAK